MLRAAGCAAETAGALKDDWPTAELSAADHAMLDYAARLTTAPSSVGAEHVVALRSHGFDDRAVLQINLITSFFNYINRVADGLGVSRGRT